MFSSHVTSYNAVSSKISHIKAKSCDDKLAALTSMSAYPNATVKGVHNLAVPDNNVEVSTNQWIDPDQSWTKADFDRKSQRVIEDNLNVKNLQNSPSSLDFSEVKPTQKESKSLVNAEKDDYFKHVVEKMMDFASSKYALLNSNINSDQFNEFYRSSLDELKQCSKDVDRIRNNISDMLGTSKDKTGEIEDINKQIDINDGKRRRLEDDKNKDAERINQEFTQVAKQWEEAKQRSDAAHAHDRDRYASPYVGF